MFHSLSARCYLLCADHHIPAREAVRWVVRRLPRNLQHSYRWRLMAELAKEGL